MRFIVLVKANKYSEAGVMPSGEIHALMTKYNEELAKAGVMLGAEGLHPSAKGVRVKFSGEERTVIPGPFPETDQLIAGFWLWQAESMEKAIEWLKLAPFGGGVEIELRPIFELEDFGEVMTPALRKREEQLRAEVARAKDSFR
jgi:hypothetical protein